MKAAKVYKVKIRENILRQMIFTDKNIMIGVLCISSLVTWVIGEGINLSLELRVFSGLVAIIIILLALTAQIDRQPTYIILKRFCIYIFRQRKIRN